MLNGVTPEQAKELKALREGLRQWRLKKYNLDRKRRNNEISWEEFRQQRVDIDVKMESIREEMRAVRRRK